MGIGALRRHYARHAEVKAKQAEPVNQPETPQTPDGNTTPEKLAELMKDPKFAAAYEKEQELAEQADQAKKDAEARKANKQKAAESKQ